MRNKSVCTPVRAALLGCCLLTQGVIAGEVDLRLEGGTVSGTVANATIAEVGRALARQGVVEIRLMGADLDAATLNLRFERAPVAEALKEILKNTSYAQIAAPPDQGGGIRVLVYSWKGAPPGPNTAPPTTVPVPDSAAAASLPPRIPPDIMEGDPGLRAAALESAIALQGAQGLPLALAAGQDPDPAVRHASEELILGKLRDAIAAEDLTTLALRADRSDIRQRALEALAERPSAPSDLNDTLRLALHDDDAGVRTIAGDLLAGRSSSADGGDRHR